MGIGASAGYIAPMLLATRWFPRKYHTIVTGSIVLVECLGAICGNTLILFFMRRYPLEKVLFGLAWLGLLLAILIGWGVKDRPSEVVAESTMENTPLGKKLLSILGKKQSWWIAACATLMWAPTSIFASLWGINFMHQAYNLSKLDASYYMTMAWVGVGLGGPLVGIVLKFFPNRYLIIKICALNGLLASLFIIFYPIPLYFLPALLFFLGSASSAQVVTFGMIYDRFPQSYSATVFGFVNMCICFGNAIYQNIASILLDISGNREMINGSWHYLTVSYKTMLLLMPISFMTVFFIATVFERQTGKIEFAEA